MSSPLAAVVSGRDSAAGAIMDLTRAPQRVEEDLEEEEDMEELCGEEEEASAAAAAAASSSPGEGDEAKKAKAKPRRWTDAEDAALCYGVEKYGERRWKAIAAGVGTRDHMQCLQRWKKVLKRGLVKDHWTAEEDDVIRDTVGDAGAENFDWQAVAAKLPLRSARECRERYKYALGTLAAHRKGVATTTGANGASPPIDGSGSSSSPSASEGGGAGPGPPGPSSSSSSGLLALPSGGPPPPSGGPPPSAGSGGSSSLKQQGRRRPNPLGGVPSSLRVAVGGGPPPPFGTLSGPGPGDSPWGGRYPPTSPAVGRGGLMTPSLTVGGPPPSSASSHATVPPRLHFDGGYSPGPLPPHMSPAVSERGIHLSPAQRHGLRLHHLASPALSERHLEAASPAIPPPPHWHRSPMPVAPPQRSCAAASPFPGRAARELSDGEIEARLVKLQSVFENSTREIQALKQLVAQRRTGETVVVGNNNNNNSQQAGAHSRGPGVDATVSGGSSSPSAPGMRKIPSGVSLSATSSQQPESGTSSYSMSSTYSTPHHELRQLDAHRDIRDTRDINTVHENLAAAAAAGPPSYGYPSYGAYHPPPHYGQATDTFPQGLPGGPGGRL